MRYYSEDTVRRIIRTFAHTALEQLSLYADNILQNQPSIEIKTPHGGLIDEADLRDRAYNMQIRDRISFPEALSLALLDAPTILEASKE